MTDRMAVVPLSQPLGVGQRDKALGRRDTVGTPSGTIGLKALAAKVLKRDTERDNSGTNLLVPRLSEGWDKLLRLSRRSLNPNLY